MPNSNDHYQPSAPRNSGGPLGDWLLPLILLVAVPPLGVFLIAVKLLGLLGNNGKHTRHRSSAPAGARTASVYRKEETGVSSVRKAPDVQTASNQKERSVDPLERRRRRSKRLMILGGVLAILFGFASIMTLADEISYFEPVYLLQDILPTACLSLGGAGMWLGGMLQRRKLRRYRRYLSMIGKRSTISISQLAEATGMDADKVRDELQDMLDEGCFPAGFLDYGGDRLVLTGEGLQDAPPEPKVSRAAPEEAENAILAEIRAVNDAISHKKLSEQIDRVGVITAKILDYQKSHPDRSPQLHSFLSYYLPTTLKILRAYAQLEAQGVEGENISAAKGRIEGMMDKVVEGFEKQLDQLFQVDAMDITTDVQVLEQMLSKDGLSGGDTLQMGL